MTLPDQPLIDTKRQSTPAEFAHLLRSAGAIFRWERGGFWAVTDYRLGEMVMKAPELSADRSSFFISRMPNLDLRLITDFFGVISKMMVMSDAPVHTTRRKIASLGVADGILDYYTPVIERSVTRLLEKAERDGGVDFVADVAVPLPSRVLADLFCIDEQDRPSFYAWSNNMTQFFGGASQYRNEDGVEVNGSATRIRDYFVELIARRRREPKPDFLTALLERQSQFGLDDSEVVAQAVMMLVAGQITTTDQLCNNLYTLLTHPGALAQVRADLALVPGAMEECNRLDPAVTFLFRVVKAPIVLGGIPLQPEDVVFVSTHAVNRDPEVFPSPDGFDPARVRNAHFAYGHGPHFCLGAKLARLQMNALFTQLLRRFPHLSLVDGMPAARKHESLAFSGFERLPVETAVTYRARTERIHEGLAAAL